MLILVLIADIQVQEMSLSAQKYHEVVRENWNLHNMVQDLKGSKVTFNLSALSFLLSQSFVALTVWNILQETFEFTAESDPTLILKQKVS